MRYFLSAKAETGISNCLLLLLDNRWLDELLNQAVGFVAIGAPRHRVLDFPDVRMPLLKDVKSEWAMVV